MKPPSWIDVYRGPEPTDGHPLGEDEAIAELLARSTAARRRLLWLTLIGSLVAGALSSALYVAVALRVYGRVIGLFFVVGALLAFWLLRRLTSAVMRGLEAAWSRGMARRHGLSAEALRGALHMLD